MAVTNSEICIRLRILKPQRQPLGGRVDLEFKRLDTGQTMAVKGADASKDIDVSGLQRSPQGLYQITVTPTDVFKPVSQVVNIPASGYATLEMVIDKPASDKPSPAPGNGYYRVIGTVRDQFQKPISGAVVKVSDKDIRSEQPLGQPAITDNAGAYLVAYTEKEFASTDLLAPDIVVRVFGPNEQLLKESAVYYNAPTELRVDIDLSEQSYAGPSEFEQISQTIRSLSWAAFAFRPDGRPEESGHHLPHQQNRTGQIQR